MIRCDSRGVCVGVGGVQWELFFLGIGGLDMQRGIYIGGLRPSVDIILYLRDLKMQYFKSKLLKLPPVAPVPPIYFRYNLP